MRIRRKPLIIIQFKVRYHNFHHRRKSKFNQNRSHKKERKIRKVNRYKVAKIVQYSKLIFIIEELFHKVWRENKKVKQ